jgi:hypothetical protein
MLHSRVGMLMAMNHGTEKCSRIARNALGHAEAEAGLVRQSRRKLALPRS